MTYAVITTGGKQYKVELGKLYRFETIASSEKILTFKEVLLHVDGDAVQIGTPYLEGMTVSGEVVNPAEKAEKIRVFKFKAKSRYRKTKGHRQTHVLVKITSIGSAKLAPPQATKPVIAKKPASPKPKPKRKTTPKK